MKDSYLPYYEQESTKSTFHFLWDLFWTKSKRAKISLTNRMKDYQDLLGNKERLALHCVMNRYLLKSIKNYDAYDYGEGYFYQSCDSVGVRGFRDTTDRIEAMGLEELLQGKTVMEIGCNTGFLSLSIAHSIQSAVGIELNPHLIEIAQACKHYLNVDNVEFQATSFEDYQNKTTFDAVLSFANHSTFDGKTEYSIRDFFNRCHSLTKPGGLFLFESHPPEHEGDGLDDVCTIIGELFEIEERKVLKYGSFLDTNRTFVIARRAANV